MWFMESFKTQEVSLSHITSRLVWNISSYVAYYIIVWKKFSTGCVYYLVLKQRRENEANFLEVWIQKLFFDQQLSINNGPLRTTKDFFLIIKVFRKLVIKFQQFNVIRTFFPKNITLVFAIAFRVSGIRCNNTCKQ